MTIIFRSVQGVARGVRGHGGSPCDRVLAHLAAGAVLALAMSMPWSVAQAQATPAATAAPGTVPDAKLLSPRGSSMYFIYSNPVPGKEAEFNAWYAQHVHDVLQLPGFVHAQRYKLHPRPGRTEPPFQYLVVFEVTGSPEAAGAAIGAAVKEGRAKAPDKAVVQEYQSSVYSAIGPDGSY